MEELDIAFAAFLFIGVCLALGLLTHAVARKLDMPFSALLLVSSGYSSVQRLAQ